MRAVTHAWIRLLGLSAASTVLAIAVASGYLSGYGPMLAGAAILTLAWAKAQLVLNTYLRLSEVPPLRRGFALVLALYALLLLGLYLAAWA